MEAQVGSGGVNNNGGDQVRKIHIIYFLSRNGCIEHPHLISIHHILRNGVHLRDVKSWLSELRGKDMPESFAWSYKRRYKGGHVWQDLLDEDLLAPICDNEYVLKGSEISSTTLINNDISAYNEKEVFDVKKSSSFGVNLEDPKYPSIEKKYPLDFSKNMSIEIEESSFESNATIEDEAEDTTKNEYKREVVQSAKDKNENNFFYEMLLNKNTNDNNNNNKCMKSDNKNVTSYFKAPSLPTYSFKESNRLASSRASHMFRNWITCGTTNTHEKAVVVMNKSNGGRTSMVSSLYENSTGEHNMGQTYKDQKSCGFEKSFDSKSESKKSKNESSNYKTSGAAYKPVNGPNCSQCGRKFNPEKLHKHMQYCRGMKASAKSTNSRPKPKTSAPSPASHETFLLACN